MAAPKVEPFERSDGEWDWRFIAANGEQVCESHQGYRDEFDAQRGFETAARLISEYFVNGSR